MAIISDALSKVEVVGLKDVALFDAAPHVDVAHVEVLAGRPLLTLLGLFLDLGHGEVHPVPAPPPAGDLHHAPVDPPVGLRERHLHGPQVAELDAQRGEEHVEVGAPVVRLLPGLGLWL